MSLTRPNSSSFSSDWKADDFVFFFLFFLFEKRIPRKSDSPASAVCSPLPLPPNHSIPEVRTLLAPPTRCFPCLLLIKRCENGTIFRFTTIREAAPSKKKISKAAKTQI